MIFSNMERVNINILPINNSLANMLSNGNKISSLDEILVNKTEHGYCILYSDALFQRLDISIFAQNLINTLNKNLISKSINLNLIHHNNYSIDMFSVACGKAILNLSDYLEDNVTGNMKYTISASVEFLQDAYVEETESFVNLNKFSRQYKLNNDFDGGDDESEEYYDGEDDSEEDEEEEDEEDYLSMLGDIVDGGKNNGPNSYGSSRVLKSIKNPKRSIKRHGVIICDNKNAIQKDIKEIKKFLKDFIPGKSTWIKEYRKEVLERWIKMYVVSKKLLKKLEKEHRTKNKKNSCISKEQAMQFTRNILKRDSWNDPNR